MTTDTTLNRPEGYDATGKTNNCGIVAFAALTGIEYATVEDAVWETLKERGAKKVRKRWTGYMHCFIDYPVVAKKLGVKLKQEVYVSGKMRVSTLAKSLKAEDERVIVVVRGHAMTLQGDMLMDQCGVDTVKNKAGGYRGRQLVKQVWRLEKETTDA